MSRIIPRFLYHFTNKTNYESIMNSGLKKGHDGLLGDGVFMVEMSNFLKQWKKSNIQSKGFSMQRQLLIQATKGEKDIVLLRIPTQNLNIKDLKIRSQDELLNGKGRKSFANIFKKITRQQKNEIPIEKEKKNFSSLGNLLEKFKEQQTTRAASPNLLSSQELNFSKHCKKGTSAKNRKLFEQRKDAIEYFYPNDIQSINIEKIGEYNIGEIKNITENDLKSIFSSILGNIPEKGMLNLLT